MLKTALMLTPIFALIALAFWFLLPSKNLPILISDQKQNQTNAPEITDLNEKISNLENKVDLIESSNSALVNQITSLQTLTNKSTPSQPSVKKSPVLIPINAGGSVNSTSWTNLTSGSITIDPADYPGYKSAYLIIDLSVDVGQGTAYARLVNTQNTLSVIPSQVSTTSYLPVTLTSEPFQLPKGSAAYTIQLYNQTPNYPAQAGSSFLQITY